MGMTVIKTYCDHCGKEIDTMIDYNDCQLDIGYEVVTVDLCKECLDMLLMTVKNFCSYGERKDNE